MAVNSDLNKSVTRAMSILDQFTLEKPGLNPAEISQGAGLSKSTTHRLLATLESAQILQLDKKSGRYTLGLKAFRLGTVVSRSMELIRQADLLLWNLAENTDETFYLLVADGHETLCLRRFEPANPLRRATIVEAGAHSAFNCGGAQRVLLAHLPEKKWEEIVAHHLRRLTEFSLVSRDDLERDRREILERGYAVSWEDVALHACAFGAPVRDYSGAVVAALSVGGTVQGFSVGRLPELVRLIIDLAAELSRAIGYQPAAGKA